MTKARVSATIGFVSFVSLTAWGVAAQGPPPPPPPPPPPVFSSGGPTQPAPDPNRPIPLGSGEIRGVLVEAGSGRAIPGGVVSLSKVETVAASEPPSPRVTRTLVGPGSEQTRFGPPEPPSSFTRPAVTDAQGRFVFNALPAGTYRLNASRSAFLSANYGETRSGGAGRLLQLDAGQQLAVTFPMQRPAVIEGTVTDELGVSLVNASVQAARYGIVQGVRRATSSATVLTDDRGRYRIFGLGPGEYVVSVSPQLIQFATAERAAIGQAGYERAISAALGGRSAAQVNGLSIVPPKVPDDAVRGYAPTYYPGSTSIVSAAKVVVEPGTERSGVDITFRPVRTVRVRGMVAGSPGPHVGIQVALTAYDPAAFTGTFVNRAQPDGSFSLGNIVPGQYVLTAVTVPGSSPPGMPPPAMSDADRLWARTIIAVDGVEEPTVVLTLRPGRSISGTIVSGGRGPANLAAVQVRLASASSAASAADGPLPQATSDADGRFELRWVPAGQFTIRTTGLVKSVMIEGQDVLDFPLEVDGSRDLTGVVITLADRLGQVSGTITSADGAAVDLTAVLIAADRRYWTPLSRRILNSRADTSGRFTFNNLPAGEYLLAAVTDLDLDQLANPEFLAALSQAAVRVTVTDGGTHVQNIRVAR